MSPGAGATQDFPLTLTHLLRRAGGVNGDAEVVTQLDAEGRVERTSMAAVAARARALAAALVRLGLRAGDRVGAFAWNTRQHLEAYWGVPCAGLVLHTMNPRLSAEQIAYTVRHAGDRAILVDGQLLGTLEPVLDLLGDEVEQLVTIDAGAAAPAGAHDYEELLAGAPDSCEWPALGERSAAALCYTSGTTGDPKGVAYSHRGLVLHTLLMAGADAYRIGRRDRVLAVVPMFHAMGWNLAYLTAMVGADLVLPGRFLQPEPLTRLIEAERITASCGVPTIWMDVLRHADEHGADLSASSWRSAAAPRSRRS